MQTTSPVHEVVMAHTALWSAPGLLPPTEATLPFSLFAGQTRRAPPPRPCPRSSSEDVWPSVAPAPHLLYLLPHCHLSNWHSPHLTSPLTTVHPPCCVFLRGTHHLLTYCMYLCAQSLWPRVRVNQVSWPVLFTVVTSGNPSVFDYGK